MRGFRYAALGVVAFALAACSDPLVIDNSNNPDRIRTFTRPGDVETFIASLYTNIHNGTLGGSNDALQTQLMVMGMENVSTLANFAMGPRGAIPRNPISNARGGQGNAGNYRDWLWQHRAARMAAMGIAELNKGQVLTVLGAARDNRARAFARFAQGVALGYLALAYDSAAIITENDNSGADVAAVVVPLSGYRTVMTAALTYLDSAIALARAAPTPVTGFTLPTTSGLWFNGLAMTQAQFIQLARSYKARFRAGVARTPAERADTSAGGIVNWSQVILDADSGITADLNITMGPATGWDIAWQVQNFVSSAWHQLSQFWLGMADTSGGYNQWLAGTLPNCQRCAFLVVTPDRRFPQGTTRTAQNNNSPPSAGIAFTATPYFRNRPSGDDGAGDPMGISMYDFYRSRQFERASRNGPYPIMTRAEMRLLMAEGFIRQNTFAAAAIRIDSSRVQRGVLPTVVGLVDTVTRLPGGNACVPRIPDPATSFKSSKCGNIWDAMKWEYRLETAQTGYGSWFFAGRGWGDLPEGTAIQWPVPYNEMDARREPYYAMGGVGRPGGAARGNYGLFLGGVY